MNSEIYVDTVVIGSGILGLSIAYYISKKFPNMTIAVLDKNPTFGVETSSRNSEVIHAGIYYKKDSLKAKYCKLGREMIYDICKKNSIPFNKCGKFIVINNDEQYSKLIQIKENAFYNEVNLKYLDKSELSNIENLSHFTGALWSPDTGILDSHSLMKYLEQSAIENNVHFVYKSSFNKIIDMNRDAYLIEILDENYTPYHIKCRNFINSAGLNSDKVAKSLGIKDNFKIKPCRGRYFSLSYKYKNYFKNLIYPLPDPMGGLGTHITFDLNGKLKLGPDIDWSFSETHEATDIDLYKINQNDLLCQDKFLESGKKLIPSLKYEDISPDYVGIRPKLFVDNNIYEDFLIKEITNDNLFSIHLLGIESPGLTSALAIGNEISLKIN